MITLKLSRFAGCMIAVAVLATGCASFRGNQLPKLGPTQKSATTVIPIARVDFRLKIDGEAPTGMMAKAAPKAVETHTKLLEEVLSESGMVGELRPATAGPAGGSGEYVLRYEMDNWGNKGAAFASGIISGMTMLLIPGFAVDHYTLEAQLLDPDGKSLWTGRYEDKITSVFWLGLFPCVVAPPLYPLNAAKATFKNMYRHATEDLMKARVGQPAS